MKTADDITKFICLGENDSTVVTNPPNKIILFTLQSNDSFILKEFSDAEYKIKDELYKRLCNFIQYGEIIMLDWNETPFTVDTFDVEYQIRDIKKRLYEI